MHKKEKHPHDKEETRFILFAGSLPFVRPDRLRQQRSPGGKLLSADGVHSGANRGHNGAGRLFFGHRQHPGCGDLYEITPAEPYTAEDLDYTNSESRTSLEMADPDARPALGGAALSLEGYDTLYLGYPIWHGQAPRILSTFAEQYDFDGLTVIPFCTSGSSGIGSSAGELAMQAGSGTWLEGQRFSADVSEEELQTWLEDQGP